MSATSKTPAKKKAAVKRASTKKKTAKKSVKVSRKPATPKQQTPKTLDISDKPKFLRDNYYLPAREFVNEDLSDFLYKQILMKKERGEFTTDTQSPDQPAWGGESFLDTLLLEQLEKTQELVGYELYPTYSYARLYSPGAILEPHKDRPSCEVSVTCTLGYKGEASAIFFCKDKKEDEELPAGELSNEQIQKERLTGNPTKIILSKPGDAALYLGPKIIHWREPVENTTQLAQVFLHYVRKNGPNNSFRYDGRPPNFFLRGPLD